MDLNPSTLTSTTRNDPSSSRIVELSAVANTIGFLACLLSMLLILALRSGAVSIDALVTETKQRFGKTVTWTHPDRPVFATFKESARGLDLDKPASTPQMQCTIKEAAIQCGLAQSLASHEVRRGAVRDAQVVNKQHKISHTDWSVAASLRGDRKSGTPSPYWAAHTTLLYLIYLSHWMAWHSVAPKISDCLPHEVQYSRSWNSQALSYLNEI